MSIIIVEGVDGSGKTDLLRRLRQESSRYFWVALSSGRPKTLEEIHEVVHWIGQCAYLKLPIICDRFPLISEEVYGPTLRNRNLLDELSNREQEISTTFLLEHTDRIVYCTPPKETILKNLAVNPQLAGVTSKLDELIAKYENIIISLEEQKVPVYRYDYTKDRTPLDEVFFGGLYG